MPRGLNECPVREQVAGTVDQDIKSGFSAIQEVCLLNFRVGASESRSHRPKAFDYSPYGSPQFSIPDFH